jgi:hypothetical protein
MHLILLSFLEESVSYVLHLRARAHTVRKRFPVLKQWVNKIHTKKGVRPLIRKLTSPW